MERKWYIISTDLDIGKTTWDTSQRKGKPEYPHPGIHRSNSLGNVPFGESRSQRRPWSDPAKGQYLVHWASKFYSPSDTAHSPDQIRYAYTPDTLTFSTPQTFISYAPTPIIDLCIPPLSASTFVRFMKNASIRIQRLHESIY
jgi:hypothetical protein